MSNGIPKDQAGLGVTDQTTVFISYSHDSDVHRDQVLAFSERLRVDGIVTILDRYVEKRSPPEGWPRWMRDALNKSTQVLCVCTETYYRRFLGHEVPEKGKGADWEGALITQALYDAHSRTNKFVPVLFAESDEKYIPDPLRGQTFYVVNSKSGYDALYDALLGQSTVTPRPPGALRRKLPPSVEPLRFDDDRRPAVVEPESCPSYALVIGVSEYENGWSEGKDPKDKQFRNLKFAANDAEEFARLGEERGFIVISPLVNGGARLRDIMHGFEQLRLEAERWKGENPLVVVFFSGHGARDSAGRSYLLPYEADLDDLFATALWSDTFVAALNQIETNRLVVFMDACHAGAIGSEGRKGAALLDYDASRLFADQQLRRYVVASCAAGQQSREWDGNGVFTRHLLNLMRSPDPNEFIDEDIDLWDFYGVLKKKVAWDVKARFKDAVQEPFPNFDGRTGLVIAVNAGLKKARSEKEQSYFREICAELRRNHAKRQPTVVGVLDEYLEGNPRDPKLAEFYDFYEASRGEWKEGDSAAIAQACTRLVRLYEKGKGLQPQVSRVPSAMPDTRPSAPAAAQGPTAVSPTPVTSGHDAPELPVAAKESARLVTATATTGTAQERRCLPSDEVSYLLEKIEVAARQPQYAARRARLKDLLSQPDGITEKEFATFLERTCRDADSLWISLIDDIGKRWAVSWPKAYKPGAWALSATDLRDLPSLARRLQQPERPVDEWLKDRLSSVAAEALLEYDGPVSDSGPLQTALLQCLNTLIHGASIVESHDFAAVALRAETQRMRDRRPQGEELQQLHRLLLEDAYPQELARKPKLEDPRIVRRGGL